VWAIAADTDGIDGSEDNAGAIWSPDSTRACRAKPRRGTTATASSGSRRAVVTGPTRTNVNDYRAILIP
jgi:hydroxypyruvate reductase